MYLILCVLLRCISSGFTSKMSSRALKHLRGETFELLFVNKNSFDSALETHSVLSATVFVGFNVH